jgi:catechol 2,3-dioxygenase-like lactoylglutathione lyase family enzyme
VACTVNVPAFAGIGHVTLSVTNVDRSRRFYTEILRLTAVLEFDNGCICLQRETGFMLGLLHHHDNTGRAFNEQHTGLDHLGFAVQDRDELEAWEQRLRDHGVTFTPMRDTELGHHLNFRDPDNIALELHAPTSLLATTLRELADHGAPTTTTLARLQPAVGGAHIPHVDPWNPTDQATRTQPRT